jgi:hypothetical protein
VQRDDLQFGYDLFACLDLGELLQGLGGVEGSQGHQDLVGGDVSEASAGHSPERLALGLLGLDHLPGGLVHHHLVETSQHVATSQVFNLLSSLDGLK